LICETFCFYLRVRAVVFLWLLSSVDVQYNNTSICKAHIVSIRAESEARHVK